MHDLLVTFNTLLILFIVITATRNLSDVDRFSAYIFCLSAIIFDVAGELIPPNMGYLYYIGVSLTSLAVIYILEKHLRATDFIVKLQQVCIGFILVSLFGWLAYMLYFSSIAYSLLCTLLYLQLLSLTTNGIENVLGDNAMDSGRVGLYVHPNQGNYSTSTNKAKARH